MEKVQKGAEGLEPKVKKSTIQNVDFFEMGGGTEGSDVALQLVRVLIKI